MHGILPAARCQKRTPVNTRGAGKEGDDRARAGGRRAAHRAGAGQPPQGLRPDRAPVARRGHRAAGRLGGFPPAALLAQPGGQVAGARRQGDPPELRPRTVECEVLAGLESFCAAEVRRVLGRNVSLLAGGQAGAVRFRLVGPLAAALELRTAVAAYLLVRVSGRRPSALLGDTSLFDHVAAVRRLHPPGAFRSFRLSAPGRDSAALRRLRAELTERTGLPEDPDDGELYLRIRRARQPADGWEALVRLSPRPLSPRAWLTPRPSPGWTPPRSRSGTSPARCCWPTCPTATGWARTRPTPPSTPPCSPRRGAGGRSSGRCRSTRRATTR